MNIQRFDLIVANFQMMTAITATMGYRFTAQEVMVSQTKTGNKQ